MQVVIDINDNEYMGIKNCPKGNTSYPWTLHLYDAVKNGTPLPKGHGRLIDEDELKKIIQENDVLYMAGFNVCLCDINNTPTVIEADKETKDE